MVEPIDIRTGKPFVSRRCHEHHPPSDGASLGGAMGRARGLMGGAFMGTMMAQQSNTPTARDYVQNGLIAMWDGIENGGYGVHKTTWDNHWTDLVGGNYFSNRYNQQEPDYFIYNDNHVTCKADPKVERTLKGYDINGNLITTLQSSHIEILYRCTTSSNVYILSNGPRSVAGNVCLMKNGANRIQTVQGDGRVYTNGDITTQPVCFSLGLTTPSAANLYRDGVVAQYSSFSDGWNSTCLRIFCEEYYRQIGEYYCIRFYDRELTPTEVAANYAVDKARFNLP